MIEVQLWENWLPRDTFSGTPVTGAYLKTAQSAIAEFRPWGGKTMSEFGPVGGAARSEFQNSTVQ